jgi:hypothetical protein
MRTGIFNNHFSVHAIAGTHVITLAMDAREEATTNLLGFAFFRKKFDKKGKFLEEAWMEGYKPFEAVVPDPQPGVRYPTNLHPIQSFVWADFAVSQDRKYEYHVFPVTGTPAQPNLQKPLVIEVSPEPYKHKLHEIYFNRAVAASQAYVERFHNIKPNAKSLTPEQQKERYDWLSRGLYEAVIAFIEQAEDKRFGLRVAMYELDFPEIPVLFKQALDRGADVQILYEARGHDSQTKQNQASLKTAGFKLNDRKITYARENTDGIPHNKFMVLLKDNKPVMVWTGSTNLSEGGIFGHSNVGHCIKDKTLAASFLQYWDLLKDDPKIGALATQVSANWPDVTLDTLPQNKMTAIFSPRKGLKMLDFYAEVFGAAQNLAAITLPFNLDDRFIKKIDEDSPAVRYIMLNSGKTNEEVAKKYNADPDVIATAGSKMNNNFGQWLNEIHTGFNGSNAQYIHTKFLLKDPLGPEPMVITGSANFSQPSTNKNDENMVIIPCSNKPGQTRVQDIYLGEFFRLFDHLYFRFLSSRDTSTDEEKQKRRFLKPRPQDWVSGYYKAGTDRFKRRENFSFGFGEGV